MKNTWRIAVVAALALCLLVAFIACESDDDTIVYVTDTNGETVTDTDGKPVTMVVESTDDSTNDSSSTDSDSQSSNEESKLVAGGVDTDTNYGKLYPIS